MDETKNPWTVLSRAMVYENEWIRVDHHEVWVPRAGRGFTERFISRIKPRVSCRSTRKEMSFLWGSTDFRSAPTAGKFPRAAGRTYGRRA